MIGFDNCSGNVETVVSCSFFTGLKNREKSITKLEYNIKQSRNEKKTQQKSQAYNSLRHTVKLSKILDISIKYKHGTIIRTEIAC